MEKIKVKPFSIKNPRYKNTSNSNCSVYYKPNHNSKRIATFVCRNDNLSCITNTLCGCCQPENEDDSDQTVTISYSNDKCPFIVPTSTINPSLYTAQYYEIIIYGSNKTSFGSSCIPTTTLTVNCTGIFGGIFPGNKINTSEYTSEAVNGVQIYTGTPVAPNYYPTPLLLDFDSSFTNGVCKLTIMTEIYGMPPTSTTYNLISSGLLGVPWLWDNNTKSWYSQMEISLPTTQNSGYNVKLTVDFTLNNNTNSNKNQTWMQMDAKLAYSSSSASCGASNEATVSGKMQSITELYET